MPCICNPDADLPPGFKVLCSTAQSPMADMMSKDITYTVTSLQITGMLLTGFVIGLCAGIALVVL